jgi:xanthine dehydrogenase iron-sulfur cluster and FAD-binding subunit A
MQVFDHLLSNYLKSRSFFSSCSFTFIFSLFPRSLRAENPNPSEADIEAALDGQLCRCTGYRPIFDAFRTFAGDIEDLGKKNGAKTCPKYVIMH